MTFSILGHCQRTGKAAMAVKEQTYADTLRKLQAAAVALLLLITAFGVLHSWRDRSAGSIRQSSSGDRQTDQSRATTASGRSRL